MISLPSPGNEGTMPMVSVVTCTRGRIAEFMRASKSVQRQDYDGTIEHVVMVDDDEHSFQVISEMATSRARPQRAFLVPPSPDRKDGDRRFVYPHLATMLNTAVEYCQGRWIAFLDDDNAFETDHIRALVELAIETGCAAVHSGRYLVWPDGSPFLEPVLPSAETREEGERLFELLCSRGVWQRGSNIVLDRVDPEATRQSVNSTLMGSDDPIFLVDQNLWLIARELLIEVPIPSYSEQELAANDAPDDRMLSAFVSAGIAIRALGRATVRYTVGGISAGQFMDPIVQARGDASAGTVYTPHQ